MVLKKYLYLLLAFSADYLISQNEPNTVAQQNKVSPQSYRNNDRILDALDKFEDIEFATTIVERLEDFNARIPLQDEQLAQWIHKY